MEDGVKTSNRITQALKKPEHGERRALQIDSLVIYYHEHRR